MIMPGKTANGILICNKMVFRNQHRETMRSLLEAGESAVSLCMRGIDLLDLFALTSAGLEMFNLEVLFRIFEVYIYICILMPQLN